MGHIQFLSWHLLDFIPDSKRPGLAGLLTSSFACKVQFLSRCFSSGNLNPTCLHLSFDSELLWWKPVFGVQSIIFRASTSLYFISKKGHQWILYYQAGCHLEFDSPSLLNTLTHNTTNTCLPKDTVPNTPEVWDIGLSRFETKTN